MAFFPDGVHSEYFYGKCAKESKRLAVHDHITYEDLKGKLVIKVIIPKFSYRGRLLAQMIQFD